MSDHEINPDSPLGIPPPLTLRLNTISNARRSLARVIRLYGRGELPDRDYRGLVYGLTQLVGAFRAEFELVEFDKRLTALEVKCEN